MASIETVGLTQRYGKVTALQDVDLTVPEGTMYALLGRNGAGKTTLLKVLTGQLRASAGRATVLGKDIGAMTVQDRERVGYVAEGLRPPGWMTEHELEAYLAPLYPGWDGELAAELRRRFELDGGRRIGTLSRGQQMKAALLCALAPCPEVLFMDEPFTGMDVLTKDEIVRGLLESATRTGTTILVCSHDIAELEPLAEWVGFLEEGRLVVSQPLEALYGRFTRVQARSALPARAELPKSWRSLERAGQQLRFVLEGDGGARDAGAEVLRVLPEALDVTAQPATLREIFIALVGGNGAQGEAEP